MKINWLQTCLLTIGLLWMGMTAPSLSHANTWQHIGEATAIYDGRLVTIAFDSNDTLYILYEDTSTSAGYYGLSVKRFDNASASWQQIGQAGFAAGYAKDKGFAIDHNGTPYVAYEDTNNGNKASVMKFNGSEWVHVGQAGFSPARAIYNGLALDSNGTPYLAYSDGAHSSKASVMRFDGTSWQYVGQAGFSSAGVFSVTLALDSNEMPYVAYNDNGIVPVQKASVMHFDGTSWQYVGQAGFSNNPPFDIKLTCDRNGVPYVTYREWDASIWGYRGIVMRFDGTSWQQVGELPIIPYAPSLAFDSANTLYAAYSDEDYKTQVMRFDGTSWQQVGQAGFNNDTNAWYARLAIDSSDTLYVAYPFLHFTGEYYGEWGDPISIPIISVMRFGFISPNQAPVADAGPDQAILQLGASVQLDGSQSWDEEGDPLTYSWSFTGLPEGSSVVLSDSESVTPTFIPDVYGDYIITLTVSDGVASATDNVTVSLDNVAPVANAGTNQSAVPGENVCFDGTGSSDANEDTLNFTWTLTAPADSTAFLNDSSAENPCITIDVSGTYTVSLIVNDGLVDSEPSTVEVAVVSYIDAFNEIMQDILTAINEISLDDLKNSKLQNALTNKVNEVILLADQTGDYAEARDKLKNDVLAKMNGCAASEPPTPDKNDWIQDCASQNEIYPFVMEAIGYLESMM